MPDFSAVQSNYTDEARSVAENDCWLRSFCPEVSQHSLGPVFLGLNTLRKIYDVIPDENRDELHNKEAKLAVIIPAKEERSNRM